MAVKGLDSVLKSFDTYTHDVQEDIKDLIEKTTQDIFLEARRTLNSGGNTFPTTYGTQTINTNIDQFLDFEIRNNGFLGIVFIPSQVSTIAIYIEFSTGTTAAAYVPTLPQWAQEVARKYFITGKGTLIGRPFLLPAFFRNEVKYINGIKEILKKNKL